MILIGESLKGNVKNFRSLRFGSSVKPFDDTTFAFLEVETPQRRDTFLLYIKLKAIFGEISDLEWEIVSELVVRDNLFYAAFRAFREFGFSKSLLNRLQFLQQMLGQSTKWDLNLLYTLDGVVTYRIRKYHAPIGKIIKYSGYVKTPSSVGTKSSQHYQLNETSDGELLEEIDYYLFLSVGKLTTLGNQSSPDDDRIEGRNGIISNESYFEI